MTMTTHLPTRPTGRAAPLGSAGAAEEACAVIKRQLQMLGELAELGLEVARAVERWAQGLATAPEAAGAAEGRDQVGDVGLAYARVSRAVRQTVLLQSKLMHDLKAAAFAQAQNQARQAAARRTAGDERGETSGALESEAAESPEALEAFDGLPDLPVAELAARICRDLGLGPERTARAMAPFAAPAAASPVRVGERSRPAARGRPAADERVAERASGGRDDSRRRSDSS